MPTLVSITESPSMPGRYRWSVKAGKKEAFGDVPCGAGPEGAAAVAVEKAIAFGTDDGFSIFAPKAVLQHIPADMRSARPLGRPAELDDGKRVNVYLDAESLAIAERIGDGNVSAGIRQALKNAETEK